MIGFPFKYEKVLEMIKEIKEIVYYFIITNLWFFNKSDVNDQIVFIYNSSFISTFVYNFSYEFFGSLNIKK